MDINPQQLTGHWKAGFALDLHTSSSTPIRAMKTVKMMVDGVEKEMQQAEVIGTEAATFLRPKLPMWNINLIIPIPPSDTTREFQPVYEIAKQISSSCNLPIDFNVLKK
jgi:hypothetical protein